MPLASRIQLPLRSKRLSNEHGGKPRCNQWRAGSSLEFFIERAKKRVENARKEDAKAKVVAAEMTLTSELSALQDGEQRHAALLVEASRTSEQPPPHDACGFRGRIGTIEVFDCGAPARLGRVAVRVGATRCCHTRRRGTPTEVNSVVVNTSIRSDVVTQSTGHQRWERSEPVSVDGDFDRRWISRGIPSIASDLMLQHNPEAAVANGPVESNWRESGYGLRGVRVGEASYPGWPQRRRRVDLSLPATQMDSDTDDDERFLSRRPVDAAREEASSAQEVPTGRARSPAREFDMAMDDSSDEGKPRQADVGSSEMQWMSPVPVENRFQVLSSQESDTESCEVSDRRCHRRLRLIWNPPAEGATPRAPRQPVVGTSCVLVGQGLGLQGWHGSARGSCSEFANNGGHH